MDHLQVTSLLRSFARCETLTARPRDSDERRHASLLTESYLSTFISHKATHDPKAKTASCAGRLFRISYQVSGQIVGQPWALIADLDR
jgi:hypothetical protein